MKKYSFQAVKDAVHGPGAKYISVVVYATNYTDAVAKAEEILDISGYYHILVGVDELMHS